MGIYIINLSDKATKDLSKIQKSGDKRSIKKTLKYQFKGCWSQRINDIDRFIYEVWEQIVSVFVVSALAHYDDE